MSFKNKLILWVVLLGAAFGAGFTVEYMQLREVQAELERTQSQLQLAEARISSHELRAELSRIRDLAGLMHLETAKRNYELAAGFATQFFDQIGKVSQAAKEPILGNALEELLQKRDAIITILAQADPGALQEVQSLFARTHAVTQTD